MSTRPVKLPKAKASTDPAANRQTKFDTGGMQRVAKGMKVARKASCAECPLRRDSIAGYLGGYSPEMYLDVLHGDASLACHSSKGFHQGTIETQHVCTGVAAYRANVGHVCFSTAHDSTVAIGEDREHYFGSPSEFHDHHAPGQTSRAGISEHCGGAVEPNIPERESEPA